MKKIKIIVCILLTAVIIIQGSFFFGLTGKLGVIYIPEYIHTDDASDSRFVDPEEISSLINFGYDSFLKIRSSIKYCKNLTHLEIEFCPKKTKKIKNVDFLRNLTELEVLWIAGNSRDWSGISECKKVNSLHIRDSNFSELDYLKDMHNIRYLDIRTSSELIYSDEADFSSATVIDIKAPLIDISDIRTAVNVTGMGLDAKKISAFDTLKNLKNLEKLRLLDTDIDEESLAIIFDSDSIKKLSFLRCNFSISEEQVNEALKGFYERKVEVTLDECVFSE